MKTRRDRAQADEWTTEGDKITSEKNREIVRQKLERGSIIVEHWLYRGASGPVRLIFDDYQKFETYLSEEAYAGDMIRVWSFSEVCKMENVVAQGKCPDDNGCVPRKGAY